LSKRQIKDVPVFRLQKYDYFLTWQKNILQKTMAVGFISSISDFSILFKKSCIFAASFE